ncbi:MAG: hypothetical protein ACRCX2_27735 [Paraclostridium sp.]
MLRIDIKDDYEVGYSFEINDKITYDMVVDRIDKKITVTIKNWDFINTGPIFIHNPEKFTKVITKNTTVPINSYINLKLNRFMERIIKGEDSDDIRQELTLEFTRED